MEWANYSFVVRGKRRRKVLFSLEYPKTPSQIARELKISSSHVSKTLKEFSERDLVVCLTPKEKFGRVYNLTDEGKKLLRVLRETENKE